MNKPLLTDNRLSHSTLTDLYQLTMAQNYWKLSKKNLKTVFHLTFRDIPFGNGYIVFCGLDSVLEAVKNYAFYESDLIYLSGVKTQSNKLLFEKEFLEFLKNYKLNCNIYSVLEGTIVFAEEPVLRVEGAILDCMLLESQLLNKINFQSLIATKASRIFCASSGKPILEFGLRRAQGSDGALSASRSAYIGGVVATSNVSAGKIYDIPVVGTHSHSWVMSFESEKEAFKQYILSSPTNCVLLVDTYSTIQGTKNAISAVKEYLAEPEKNFLAIRIDSGDLAYLSKKARLLLDQAGFQNTKIIASNNLDEHIIASLNNQKAAIDTWAIGTKLITANKTSALNGVYKLSAIFNDEKKKWKPCLKISEDIKKINNPGILQVIRFFDKDGLAYADSIYNQLEFTPKKSMVMINPRNPRQKKTISLDSPREELLHQVVKGGKVVYHSPSIHSIREKSLNQLKNFDASIKRQTHPHIYPIGLESGLYQVKEDLILKNKNLSQ